MNKVSLVGRITKDPELRSSANNVPYVFFTIAINRIPSPNGERQADFINCVAWNRQAENLARFIKSGGLLGIDGTLQTRKVTDNNNQPRTVMEVYCNSIEFLESKDKNSGMQQIQQPSFNSGYNGYNQPQNMQYNGFNQQPQQSSYQSYNPGYNAFNNQPSQLPRQNESNDNPFAGEANNQFIPDDDLPF